jgi:phosphonate transport system substrate-binding protein
MALNLRAVSLLSELATPGLRGLMGYLSAQTGWTLSLDDSAPWTERERWLDAGQVDVAFVCGLLCANKVQRGTAPLEIVAAPVMAAARYTDAPIYFSDVVVHADSRFSTFEDLRGARWGFNDPGSYSGHALPRFFLSERGKQHGYFSWVMETGSHLACIDRILDGTVDAASIDSTVMDAHPRKELLRVVQVLGPSPIPPVAVSTKLDAQVRDTLVHALVHAHDSAPGREALAHAGMRRFERVSAREYEVLLERARVAEQVSLRP